MHRSNTTLASSRATLPVHDYAARRYLYIHTSRVTGVPALNSRQNGAAGASLSYGASSLLAHTSDSKSSLSLWCSPLHEETRTVCMFPGSDLQIRLKVNSVCHRGAKREPEMAVEE